jgi:hypothetical protein
MNPEINDETRLRKRVNCSLELHDSRQLRDNFTLVQSIAHTSFSNLLNTDNCGFASLLAKCGPSYGPLRCFTDVQFSTHKGWEFDGETRSTHWLRPKATNSRTMDSNLWERRADV